MTFARVVLKVEGTTLAPRFAKMLKETVEINIIGSGGERRYSGWYPTLFYPNEREVQCINHTTPVVSRQCAHSSLTLACLPSSSSVTRRMNWWRMSTQHHQTGR